MRSCPPAVPSHHDGRLEEDLKLLRVSNHLDVNLGKAQKPSRDRYPNDKLDVQSNSSMKSRTSSHPCDDRTDMAHLADHLAQSPKMA